MTTPAGADPDDLKLALDHAWGWFALHAGQRMQLVNYLLVAAALIVAGYSTALGNDRPAAAGAIAAAGVAICAAFGALDRRTAALVKAAETPLLELQDRLAIRAGVPSLALVRSVERAASGMSYTTVLRALTAALAVLAAAGAVYAFEVRG